MTKDGVLLQYLVYCSVLVTALSAEQPNFVWLHVESTDGRVIGDDKRTVLPIPNIRSIQHLPQQLRQRTDLLSQVCVCVCVGVYVLIFECHIIQP